MDELPGQPAKLDLPPEIQEQHRTEINAAMTQMWAPESKFFNQETKGGNERLYDALYRAREALGYTLPQDGIIVELGPGTCPTYLLSV